MAATASARSQLFSCSHVQAPLLLIAVSWLLLLSACTMTTSPLHSMIRDDQIDDAVRMIEKKEMINARDQMGYTPLHIAAIRGNRTIAESLLNNGADLNARDFHGRTPFMLAVREGKRDLARYFLAQGATLKTHYTLTNALFDAITGKDLEMTQYLLQHGFSANTMNRTQTTALQIAATSGDLEITKLLIARGANVDQRDEAGWSALHFAAARSHRDVVRQLFAVNATPSEISDNAPACYATGVIYEELALLRGGTRNFSIAADHFDKAAAQYASMANRAEQQIEAQHARNALAMTLGAFAASIQPGTPMPTASGGTVRLYQPVVVPLQGSANLQSARASYLAAMQDAQRNAARCRSAAQKND